MPFIVVSIGAMAPVVCHNKRPDRTIDRRSDRHFTVPIDGLLDRRDWHTDVSRYRSHQRFVGQWDIRVLPLLREGLHGHNVTGFGARL